MSETGEAVVAYVGVGSNVRPRENVPAALELLMEQDPDLVLPHTRQPLSCLWAPTPPPGMTPDIECSRALKENLNR